MTSKIPSQFSINDFPVSGAQLRAMLKLAGFSMSDFADFINRSPSFVSATLAQHNNILPPRRTRQLLGFLGHENFLEAYRQTTTGEIRKALPVKLLKPLLKQCGFSIADFCRAIGKSHSFFLDNSSAFRASLPLAIIDKLQAFLGEQDFLAALDEVNNSLQQSSRTTTNKRIYSR